MSLETKFEQESTLYQEWTHLEERPHPWRKSLFLKNQKLRAFTVWTEMLTEGMSQEEAARNWNLPLEAIEEIVQYSETHPDVLQWESDEERRRLMEKGIALEPPSIAG